MQLSSILHEVDSERANFQQQGALMTRDNPSSRFFAEMAPSGKAATRYTA